MAKKINTVKSIIVESVNSNSVNSFSRSPSVFTGIPASDYSSFQYDIDNIQKRIDVLLVQKRSMETFISEYHAIDKVENAAWNIHEYAMILIEDHAEKIDVAIKDGNKQKIKVLMANEPSFSMAMNKTLENETFKALYDGLNDRNTLSVRTKGKRNTLSINESTGATDNDLIARICAAFNGASFKQLPEDVQAQFNSSTRSKYPAVSGYYKQLLSGQGNGVFAEMIRLHGADNVTPELVKVTANEAKIDPSTKGRFLDALSIYNTHI